MLADNQNSVFKANVNFIITQKLFLNNFQSTIEQWRIVFWIVFGVDIVRVAVFSIWASGSIQTWNNPKKRVSFECEKLTDDRLRETAVQNTSK